MSDLVPSKEALRRTLAPCIDVPGCPCGGIHTSELSATGSSASASPSRSGRSGGSSSSNSSASSGSSDSGSEILIHAEKQKESATKKAVAMKMESSRTKREARRVCTAYHKKAVSAVVDKTKYLYVIYCLLGVNLLLAVFLFVLMVLKN